MRPSSGFVKFSREIYQIWVEERPTQLAAALAYYGVFSFAPVIYLAYRLSGILIDEIAAAERFSTRLEAIFGTEAVAFIQDAVAALQSENTGGSAIISLISLLAMLYAASRLFYQLQYALNSIWEVEIPQEKRSRAVIRQRLLSFIVVILLGLLVILATGINVFFAWFGSIFETFLPSNDWIFLLNFLALLLLVVLTNGFMYKVLPAVELTWRDVWPGSAVATVLMVLGGLVMGIYFRLGGVNSALEAAGALAILLIGIYYFAQIFLFGAIFTRAYANRYGSRRQLS